MFARAFGPKPTDTTETAEEWVNHLIKSHPVILFSKTYCAFSLAAKTALASSKSQRLFAEHKIKPYICEIDKQQKFTAESIQMALRAKSGISSVPQMFYQGNFVGDSKSIVNQYG